MSLTEQIEAVTNPSPKDSQRLRRELFWAIIMDSPIYRWTIWSTTPAVPLHLRIGLAPSYSQPDVQLAEKLLSVAKSDRSINIALFDVTELKQMSDLDSFLPGINKAFQTPMVGVWKNGLLIEIATGFLGRELILKELNEPPP